MFPRIKKLGTYAVGNYLQMVIKDNKNTVYTCLAGISQIIMLA